MRELCISILSLTFLGCAAVPADRLADASAQVPVEDVRTGGTRGSPYVVPDAADPRADEPGPE